MGLAGAIPYILQEKHVPYDDQAMFSLVSWPFSLKLLWAPIVDTVYVQRFGRRKTWLIPTQFAIGATMLLLGFQVCLYASLCKCVCVHVARFCKRARVHVHS